MSTAQDLAAIQSQNAQARSTPEGLWPRVEPPHAVRSNALDQLALALSKAQAKIKTAEKDANNPHFNSRYADLASVWEACRDALTSEGLCVVQLPCGDGDRVGLTTTLLHASGQWMASTIFVSPERKGPQAVGSVITYLRRYALAAAAGVAPDDDDGDSAEPERAPAPANDNGRRISAAKVPTRQPANPPLAQDGPPAPSSNGPSLGAMRKYHALRAELKVSEDEGRDRVSLIVGRTVKSITDISAAEMSLVLAKMEERLNSAS